MKTSELRAKTIDDLQKEMTALLKEQFNLRMQRGSGQDVKPHLFNKSRKGIARIQTLINEKKIAGES
ncbi:MAG: 50S ribosomal protein L29 [Gammaproteobacteria bacterium]|nr:50S ribosomal protein L29 [Gammaproteobacteria bacterium]